MHISPFIQHLNQLILSSRTGFTLTIPRERRYRRY